MKRTPLEQLVSYMQDDDFRDNFKGKALIEFLEKQFIVSRRIK